MIEPAIFIFLLLFAGYKTFQILNFKIVARWVRNVADKIIPDKEIYR